VEKFFDEVAQGKFFVVGKVAQGNTATGIKASTARKTRRLIGTILNCVNMMQS
jgi:hypothetical protein